MENFKIDPGAYFPTVDNSSLISPIIREYQSSGASIQSQEDFARSISMPGDSITELMAKVEQYTAMTENILGQTPSVPSFGPGTQVDLGKSINKLAQAINPEQATLRAAARPQVLGTADDLARYAESENFQTFGYTPSLGSEQEYRYGRAMTWTDTIGKALAGGGALAYDTFIEGWKGWGRMAEALFTWDASKLYGSPEERMEIAKQQEAIFNKYAIYNTAESEDSLLNRQFFGNMLQQTGFTVGAIGQMLAETYLTVGITKAIGLAAGGLGKANALKTAVNVGELVNDTRKVQQVIANSQRVNNALNNIARSVVPLFGTSQDLIKAGKAGAGMLQLGMIGAGGVKRELSMFNMARSEAIFEAASTYKDLEDRLVRDFVQRNGREPNESELNVIRNTADNASADNFYVNTGILTLMNRVQFGNMFKSFNTTRKIFNEGLSSFGDDVFEVSGKVGAKTQRKVYEKGFFGSLGATRDIAATFGKKKAAWEATKSVGRGLMKFEGSEGAQELLQEASNKGLSEYYYDLYNGKKGYGSKLDAIMDNIQNPITSLEGAKTFLMGALTGRLIAPFSYAGNRLALSKEAKGVQAKKAEAINIINSFYADPTQYVKEQIANVKVQNRAAETMEEAAKNQDRYTFNNAKDSAFAKAVASAIKLNMYESLKDSMLEFGQQMTEEEFQKAFSMDPSSPNRKSVNDFIGKVVSQMDEYYTVYQNLRDKYGDRIVPELYKNNSPEEYEQVKLAKFAQDQAIEMLATNLFRSRQATKRAVQLTSEMAANPNIGSSATEMITKLGSEQAIDSTIQALQREIKNLESAAATLSPEQRELLNQKKEELQLAEAWKTNYESIMAADDENYTSATQERAYKAYQDIINHYNKVAKKETAVTREDIDDNFLRMVDYLLLNRDSKNFIDAMNLLADPYNMTLITSVIKDSLPEAGKKFQAEHIQEVNNIGETPAEEQSAKSTEENQKDIFAASSIENLTNSSALETRPELKDFVENTLNMNVNDSLKDIKEAAAKFLEQKQKPGQPEQPVAPDRPANVDDSVTILKAANGIYLIKDTDPDNTDFYYITDANGGPVLQPIVDDKLFPVYNPEDASLDLDLMLKIFDHLQSKLSLAEKEFKFDGKTLKYGVIIVDDKGRRYKVLTKGQPHVVKGKPKIAIQPLSGSISTLSIESLNGFRLESEIEQEAGPMDPNAFRLQRANELTRVYAHRNPGESVEQASERLKQLIHNTPKETLLAGMTIQVVKNEELGESSLAAGADGANPNRHLRQNPEPYSVQILFNGQPIGYATYYNRYTYLDAQGREVSVNALTKSDFANIFDAGDKNVDEEMRKFKTNYEQSRQFHSMLISKMGEETSKVFTAQEIGEMFNIEVSAGEYAFVGNREERPTFDTLDYTTVDGFTYIIDHRTRYLGEGMYEDDSRVQTDALEVDDITERVEAARYVNGEDKIRNYGRYVAAVELPNGQIKFVELQSPAYSVDEMNNLVEKLNAKSKNLKETNLVEKTDEKTKTVYMGSRDATAANDINADINDAVYITVGGRRGVRVNLSMSNTGNIRVEFATFIKGEKNPRKRVITISESETDATKPLNIKDAADLIERLNRAISDHDTRNPSKAIGVKFDKNSFKRNLAESSPVSEYRQMLAGTEASVVKNGGIFFSVKKNQQASTPANPVNVPTQKLVDDIAADMDNVVIPDHILAEQAELLKQMKQKNAGKQSAEQTGGPKKSVQEQVQELSDKRDQLIITIEKELRDKGMSRKDAMRYDYDADPRIAEINQEIARLNGGAALKVADSLTEQDIEDINVFSKWVQENLPEFISVEELGGINRRMKEDGVTIGMFYMQMNNLKDRLEGRIAVGADSGFKYHEAFHSVFRMLLTDKQIDTYYNIAREELRKQGKTMKQLKEELYNSKPSFYSKLTDKQLEDRVLEEYLADKFDAWKRDIKTQTSPVNKGLFRRLLDFIMNFFRRLRGSDLDGLFNKIDKGGFKSKGIVKNRFTAAPNIAVSDKALKSLQVGTRVITNEDGVEERIPVFLSQEESDVLVSTIAAIYHRRMQKAGLKTHDEDIMDDILVDYLNLYDRDTNPYYESDEFLDRFENALALDKAKKKIDDRAKIFRNPELRQVLKDAIRKHTLIMGYQDEQLQEDFNDKVDEYGDRVTTDNWKETYSIGGYGSLSKELRQYLSTIVEEKADEFGNTHFIREDGSVTEEALVEAANANVLYNGILKAVAGSTSQQQLLERLEVFALNNPEARKFWTRFTQDVDLIRDEEGNYVDIGNKDQANLFQAVVKGFMQHSVNYYFINKDIKNRITRISEANKKGAAKNQFSIWYNAFVTLFVDQLDNINTTGEDLTRFMKRKVAPLDKLATLLKKGNKYKRDVLNREIENIILSLRNELGISLSPLYLRYSYLSSLDVKELNDEELRIVRAFDGVEAMTEEDAREIASVIKAGKNPFGSNIDPDKLAQSDEQVAKIKAVESKEPIPDDTTAEDEVQVEDDVDGAVGRLTRIAEANAVFDEQVSTTSYKNAEGEMVYAHQLPTFNLVRAAELQSDEFRDSLKKDEFLTTNFLLNNPLFNAIAPKLKISRIDGIKDSMLTVTDEGRVVEDKQLNVNQNKGITYGSMGGREFLLSLFELYSNNKKHVIPATEGQSRKEFMTSSVLLGVLEASNTGDMLDLPVVRSVEYNNGQIVLTQEVKLALLNEVKREFDRINRVQKEINDGLPNGMIDGYNTGQMRGLKFIKMGNMLGKTLADTLATGARNDANFDVYVKDVIQAMEKYWLGEGGQVDQMINMLLDMGAIAKNDENELYSKLLSNYLFTGFKNGKTTDKQRNSMLNIRPNAPRHNIAQVMLSNYINTLSARQLFIGDAAQNYKDDGGIDEVKRNKGLNGSGASIASVITAPQLGINHANVKSFVATIEDPLYRGQYAGKNKEKADAQMWMTVKALRYTLFGLGKLNQAQAELLDKIERGESVSSSDIFGDVIYTNEGKRRINGGSIEYNAQANSIKLVYNDGKKYVKTSGVILSKDFTAVKVRGTWQARPGFEELDKLRVKLEEFESRNQTIAFAIPKSASKGLKKNIAKNVDAINDDTFQEHDNNFWRLQLENPSNKTVITDPTQAKQLIIAEQSADLVVTFQGKEMLLKDVIEQYLSDTEQRVKNNFFSARDEMFDIKGAFRELGKSLKQDSITPKLGKFLARSVETLESTGADAQLLEFFKPAYNSKTGEYTPRYDLNHPITLDKFTQLFLAYFSKGVMSEKVPGHSVALMSNWGTKVAKQVIEVDENGQPKRWKVITQRQYEKDAQLFEQVKNAKRYNNDLDRQFEGLQVGDIYLDDLRHNVPEYDEKGNITGYFTEYMMPPHFREDMNIYDKDGNISEAALYAFGVRIPSQDKHSFISLKLVDFMPAYYGSTAIFPHELIEISGADFDIDKLYMQIRDSYVKEGKRVPYGTATTPEEKYNEYITYLVTRDKAFRAKLRELEMIGPDERDEDILGNLDPAIRYDSMEQIMEDLFSKNLRGLIIENALREMNLPKNAAEYMELVNTGVEPNNGVLNNRILDAKIKLLNNEKMVTSSGSEAPIAFQVAEVQPLLSAIDSFIERFPVLHDVLIETGSDVDSMMGQYKAFKNNKEGARNIGPAVNAMLVYALMNSYKVQIRKENSAGNPLFVLNIDGHDFDSYGHNRAFVKKTTIVEGGGISEEEGYIGDRIFYNISAIVSAMTDNAKERLAARLGLNINAVGVVSNMVALGVPLETALMFNLQPSVRKFYHDLNVSSNGIKTGTESEITRSKIGEKIMQKLIEQIGEKTEDHKITTDLLEKNIRSNGSNPAVDLAIFEAFYNFYKQTESYSSVAQVLKLSKGLGTSNENIDAIEKKEEQLGLRLNDVEFEASNIPFDLRQVLTGKDPKKPHHRITANYIKIKDQIKDLQKSVFLERTYMFRRLRSTVMANMSVNYKEAETFETTLKRDIIAYLGIKAYMNYLKTTGKGVKLSGLDNAMIYDSSALARGEGFLDIIDTVRQIREQLPKNYFAKKFLNIIPVKLRDVASNQLYDNPKGRAGINVAETNTWAKLGAYEQSRLEDSFLEIYSNPATRHLAYNLFNYLIVKDGGQFKSGSFIKFIPPAMFKELLDSTKEAHELLRRDDKIRDDQAYKDVFGATAKDLFNEFTELYTTNVNNTFSMKRVFTKPKLPVEVEKKRPKNYVPEVAFLAKDGSMLRLDMFGGIRKPEMTLLTDEYGNEFYAETIGAGKFSPEEMDKLNYNKEYLKAMGFSIVNRPDETGANRYYIGLPYTIKINISEDPTRAQYQYLKLRSVGKAKDGSKLVERTARIITREELQNNPTTIYLFGDNDMRKGLGGQAKEMRGEPNAVGISTKKIPTNDPEAFKSDEELDENKRIVTADIDKVIEKWRSGSYTKVVIPTLGVGLAKLPEKAPETYAYLQKELKRLEKEISSFVPMVGVGDFIKNVGDDLAFSNTAIYEKFEPLGSRKQWKAGGVTGAQPTAESIRRRNTKNSLGFDLNDLDRQLTQLDNMLGRVNSMMSDSAAYDLATEWGIIMEAVGNKLTFFKLVNGKKEVYNTEARTPAELLEALRQTMPEEPGEVVDNFGIPDVDIPESSPNIPNFDNIQVDEQQAQENLKKLLAARKKEIDQRKEQDDAGCEA